ncbi:MAG: hypothetical protein ACO2ZK_05605, partial [Gemmobacter sp.]
RGQERAMSAGDGTADVDAALAPLHAAAEELMLRLRTHAGAPLALHDLQAVERDFAFVLDARTEAQAVVQAALGADKALIEGVRVFDEFAGPAAEAQLGAGRKSLAISVRLQPTGATLTEADIEAVGRRIVEKVGKATGGVLRG